MNGDETEAQKQAGSKLLRQPRPANSNMRHRIAPAQQQRLACCGRSHDVDHRSPARQAVTVLPAQQRLAHSLKQLLGALQPPGGEVGRLGG